MKMPTDLNHRAYLVRPKIQDFGIPKKPPWIMDGTKHVGIHINHSNRIQKDSRKLLFTN